MFKFKGISSEDMQVIIEEEEHFIAKAAQRYLRTEIEGKDGAYYEEQGYSDVERPIRVQCLNINKIDAILAWLNGVGEFEYKGRKTIARFYSQAEPERVSCIRIIDMMFIRHPFWYKANEEFSIVKGRKDRTTQVAEELEIIDCAEENGKLNIDSGKTKQAKYDGNQLVNFGSMDTNRASYTFIDDVLTVNATGEDYNNVNYSIVNIYKNNPGKKIKFKCENIDFSQFDSTNLTIVQLQYTNNGTTYYATLATKNGNSLSYSSHTILSDTSGVTGVRIRVYANNTNTENNTSVIKITKPLLYLEDNDTYEPYVEAVPAPSPDYPQDIISLGSNINLWGGFANSYTRTSVGVTLITNTNGTINANGTATNSTQSIAFSDAISNGFYKELKPGTYTISCPEATTNKEIQVLNESGTLIGTVIKSPVTITLTEQQKIVLRLSTKANTTFINELFHIKLEKGSTATSYSPYNRGSIGFKVRSKNILPNNLQSQRLAGLDIEVNKDKSFKITGTTNNTNYVSTMLGEIDFEPFLDKEITVSIGYRPVNNVCALTTALRDRNGNTLINNAMNVDANYDGKRTITISSNDIDTSNGVYLRYSLGIQANTNRTVDIDGYLQLELGDTATPYVEHQEQNITIPLPEGMELCKIGNYEDKFIKQNGKWYKYNAIDEIIYDGTENWGKSNTTAVDRFVDTHLKVQLWNVLDGRCNCLKYKYNISDNSIGYRIDYYQENSRVIMDYAAYGTYTLQQFKDLLTTKYNAGNPLKVKYVKITPTYTEITDTDTLEGLYQLEHMLTYEGYTHIECLDEMKPDIYVDYFDITDETMDNEGNEKSSPVLRLEKTVSDQVELTINNIRFSYNFNDDSYVEIDCEEKTVKYEGLNRNRSITIGYEFPKLNIGQNKIIMHSGDCIIKAIRKDRWL